MHIFKTRIFAKWARKEKLADKVLDQAVKEMEKGLVDADLGGHVFKKRIFLQGRGKRGGARVIIAYRVADKAFFIYGFAKNEKANISREELRVAKAFANELLNYSAEKLGKLIKDGELIEVKV